MWKVFWCHNIISILCLINNEMFKIKCLINNEMFKMKCLINNEMFKIKCLIKNKMFKIKCLINNEMFKIKCLINNEMFKINGSCRTHIFIVSTVPADDLAPLSARTSADTVMTMTSFGISRVSCQKGPTHHAYAWQIGPFWQDTLDMHRTTVWRVWDWLSEWINLTAFLRTADSKVHIVHISCIITAFTSESLSSLT